MNKTEYLAKKLKLKAEAEEKQHQLAKEYVLSNTTIRVGDFVADHIGTIKVEKITIGYGFSRDNPKAIYYGLQYTKSGKPFKSGAKRSVWAGNVVNS